jgi:ADP-ribose pyrophosphatase
MSELHLRPWEVLSRQSELDASPWVQITREHVRLPNGVEMDDWYRIDLAVFSIVFAVTSDNQVVLTEQYRHGPGRAVFELPAGDIGEPFTPDNALEHARRELREETGYTAADWHYMGRFFIDSNRGCGEAFAFLARQAEQTHEQDTDDSELIGVHLVSLDALRERWLNAEFDYIGATAIIGLGLAHLERLHDE